jgi:hypothetical protein
LTKEDDVMATRRCSRFVLVVAVLVLAPLAAACDVGTTQEGKGSSTTIAVPTEVTSDATTSPNPTAASAVVATPAPVPEMG